MKIAAKAEIRSVLLSLDLLPDDAVFRTIADNLFDGLYIDELLYGSKKAGRNRLTIG